MWVTILVYAAVVFDLILRCASEVSRKTWGKTRGLGPTFFHPVAHINYYHINFLTIWWLCYTIIVWRQDAFNSRYPPNLHTSVSFNLRCRSSSLSSFSFRSVAKRAHSASQDRSPTPGAPLCVPFCFAACTLQQCHSFLRRWHAHRTVT